jgi:hypothetical protein
MIVTRSVTVYYESGWPSRGLSNQWKSMFPWLGVSGELQP